MNPETDKLLAITLILIISIAGCRSTGSKTSFLSSEQKKAQLSTYKENMDVAKADGNITPPSQLAKSSATAELARHRLADSGYPTDQLFGPGYEKPGTAQLAASQTPNYSSAEQLIHQSNAKADQNQTPVAYKPDSPQPPTGAQLAESPTTRPASLSQNAPAAISVAQNKGAQNDSIPPMPDLPSPYASSSEPVSVPPRSAIAGNAAAVSGDLTSVASPDASSVNSSLQGIGSSSASATPGSIPAAPEAIAMQPAGPNAQNSNSTGIAANASADKSIKIDPQVTQAGYISEKEAQAYQENSRRNVFLPGSLDSTRYNEFNVSPNAGATGDRNTNSTAENNTTGVPSSLPPANPGSGDPVPGCVLPGFGANFDRDKGVNEQTLALEGTNSDDEELSPLGIPESAFCSMSYHEVAQLVYQMTGRSPELVQSEPVDLAESVNLAEPVNLSESPDRLTGSRQSQIALIQETTPSFMATENQGPLQTTPTHSIPIVQTSYVRRPDAPAAGYSQTVSVSPDSFSEVVPPILMNILP